MWVMFTLQFLIRKSFADLPMEVLIQRERQQFVNSRILDKGTKAAGNNSN